MYPKTYFASGEAKERSGTCFVIMPFEPQFVEVYDTIRETLEGPELCFNCARADDIKGGGHIIKDILRGIGEAEIVIADLTGHKPNVFYELGIVQMVKDVEKVILLTQNAGSIPFDIKVFRCIEYQQTIAGARKLHETLLAAVQAVAAKSFRFGLSQGGSYKLPKKLMGADHYIYDFEISACGLAADGAKFMLKVTRFAAGKSPAVCFDDGFGLMVGEKRQIPNLDWHLVLESVEDDAARFAVQRHV